MNHMRKNDKRVVARQMKGITEIIEVENNVKLLSSKYILMGNLSYLTQFFSLARYVQL